MWSPVPDDCVRVWVLVLGKSPLFSITHGASWVSVPTGSPTGKASVLCLCVLVFVVFIVFVYVFVFVQTEMELQGCEKI